MKNLDKICSVLIILGVLFTFASLASKPSSAILAIISRFFLGMVIGLAIAYDEPSGLEKLREWIQR
jgi:hypothetical protein